MGGRIRVETDGGIGWLVFDHPERRNAISVQMWQELPGAVESLASDDDVRVVVIRGAGEEAFVSGADISEFAEARTGENVDDYDRGSGKGFLSLATLEKPVLAMIHGYCIGGGLALSLAADLRYCDEEATFGIPAAKLGLGYPAPGIDPLRHLVGPSAAKEIFFTARRFSAEEALRMGLVNAVKPRGELEEFVRRTAARIAANAPLTIRSVKLAVGELAKDPARRDDAMVAQAVRACFDSEDYREGMRAFLEKRRPVFKGR